MMMMMTMKLQWEQVCNKQKEKEGKNPLTVEEEGMKRVSLVRLLLQNVNNEPVCTIVESCRF